MSCYKPKRKTATGTEEVTIPISCIKGLSEELEALAKKTIAMPMIRLANAIDSDSTMVISESNPLRFSVEIIDGELQVGDVVQICTRELVTYDQGHKRKYRLRNQWWTEITEENVNDRFIFVFVSESIDSEMHRFFRTESMSGSNTFSPVYIRVRRPIFRYGTEVDSLFSNVVTVWKKFDRRGKVFIK